MHKYRMLKKGETIRKGDETLNGQAYKKSEWFWEEYPEDFFKEKTRVGDLWKVGEVRRPIGKKK